MFIKPGGLRTIKITTTHGVLNQFLKRYDDWKFKTSKVKSTTMTKQGGSAELSAERFGWRLCQTQLEKRGTTICTSVWRLTCRVGRLLVLRLLTLAIPWHCMRAVTKWHKWSLKNVIIHVNLVFAQTLPNCFQKNHSFLQRYHMKETECCNKKSMFVKQCEVLLFFLNGCLYQDKGYCLVWQSGVTF